MIDSSRGFTVERLLDATPEQIWTAWTDADEAAQWWHPAGATTPRESVSIDPRVGGLYTYTMVDDTSGEEFPTGGQYLEVVPQERLVFTWGEPGADPDDTPVVTVTIASAGDLARLTFDLRGVDGTAGDESYYDGWASALDELVTHLGQSAVHG
ncbi:SRPBCC domain-containing protein [Microbacterium sp. P06]|uniref:SRPBCC family protein n=1 Tax=unclassified Microbacterium TaxID=2609290 RepID=UPI0037458DF2